MYVIGQSLRDTRCAGSSPHRDASQIPGDVLGLPGSSASGIDASIASLAGSIKTKAFGLERTAPHDVLEASTSISRNRSHAA